jgi:hypothetical protein
MAAIYIETTIPSYLVGRPNRDLVVSAHQQITLEWWEKVRPHFQLVISEAVLEENRAGDPDIAACRLEVVNQLPILKLNDDVRRLVQVYNDELGLPKRAGADLLHIRKNILLLRA